ncbi:hypothetical protein Glove_365g253 [Diversispora epigaea]|uniref:Uncharacterized protein n=1 Tax=Diversispora epigaea TaxID=1348612 RepID=A0A397HAY3_9GLOM|nr:hypothetical protein Glove_365g253 [Diversispora epigaea]
MLKNVGLYEKFRGTELFGLEHSMTQKIIHNKQYITCTSSAWNNELLMNDIYNYHLQKRTIADMNFKSFFIEWLNQHSTIIELYEKLQKLYPSNYILDDHELRAWRTMLKAVGCVNITPFEKMNPRQDATANNYNDNNDDNNHDDDENNTTNEVDSNNEEEGNNAMYDKSYIPELSVDMINNNNFIYLSSLIIQNCLLKGLKN